RHGEAALRGGAVASAIVSHLADNGGLVTAEDFLDYAIIEREPLRLARGDVELITNPPPSAGGVLILAALGTIAPDLVVDEASFYQALADAGTHANGLRTDDFIDALHDPDFAEALLATPSRKPTGTTNVAVVDSDGMMVSLSSSCGSGSGVVVPETGILLNNMLGEEDLNPGGFGQVRPGMRMTSMMAPTIAVRRGTPMVALGSAGSNRLRSAILQTLVDVIDRGRSVHEAVDLARIHPERDGIDVEFGVPDQVCDALAAGGYRLRRWQSRNLFFGGVSAVSSVDGRLDGAGDPRRGGAAAGVTHDGEVVDL
ncbi:MAG TPA: gamma-glutamyltransferase, partial [Miltoncostaeales bacterium]|nr:gamma-glutamyltransferase [Miltoncostaeales bacterium]